MRLSGNDGKLFFFLKYSTIPITVPIYVRGLSSCSVAGRNHHYQTRGTAHCVVVCVSVLLTQSIVVEEGNSKRIYECFAVCDSLTAGASDQCHHQQ